MLTTREAASRLAVSPRTVLVWIDKGLLPAFRVGGVVRIDSDVLELFILRGCRTDNPIQAG